MAAPVLVFTDVTLGSGQQSLLGPIDLRLETPGITVIMGPNGAGKSLFLGAAHGLPPRHSGRVTWDGIDAALSRATRGFLFQQTPVLRRSVAGNIAFALRAQGIKGAERRRRVANALSAARLGADPRKPAATLSGGERKRLDLARAIAIEPAAVLLDEPSANLDPATTAELEDILRRISAAGTKILLATHDVAQARRLASDVLFFADGHLLEQTDAATFFKRPASADAQKYLKGEL